MPFFGKFDSLTPLIPPKVADFQRPQPGSRLAQGTKQSAVQSFLILPWYPGLTENPQPEPGFTNSIGKI
jgi:hypothetical protein